MKNPLFLEKENRAPQSGFKIRRHFIIKIMCAIFYLSTYSLHLVGGNFDSSMRRFESSHPSQRIFSSHESGQAVSKKRILTACLFYILHT